MKDIISQGTKKKKEEIQHASDASFMNESALSVDSELKTDSNDELFLLIILWTKAMLLLLQSNLIYSKCYHGNTFSVNDKMCVCLRCVYTIGTIVLPRERSINKA